jgi:5'-3' exonuclease
MGIPSYFSHIVKNHRHIIKKYSQNKDKINNLYLDSNSIIYDAVNEIPKDCNYVQIEDKLIKSVCDKLIYYIKLLQPTNNLFIAFDGVAPVAKLDQQRRRRYMSWFQSQLTSNGDINNKWNTSAITPGTSFMNQLSISIKTRFSNPKEFGLHNIIISASDDAGEGEHKIYEFIRNNKDYHKSSSTVIYGLDADLIMLTLNHLHISDKMYLFRETPHFIKSLDNTLDPSELYLLDIPQFGLSIIDDLNGTQRHNSSDILKPQGNKLFDYIFICFLLGNDFMPHFPALNIRTKGIDRLMNSYKHILGDKNLYLTNGDKIIWKNFRKYMEYLASNELEYIQDEYKIRNKMANRKPFHKENEKEKEKENDELLMVPMKDRSVELYINPFEDGWRERYYSSLFDIKINDERCKEICINYLEGLEWTMKYYTSGCINWRWTYKYHYPPLLSDLIKYIPYFDTCLLDTLEKNPVSPIVQLCYVLPKNTHYLLPQKINAKISKEHPEWYDTNCKFQWAFCKYFWESHIDMPHIDISELSKTVTS